MFAIPPNNRFTFGKNPHRHFDSLSDEERRALEIEFHRAYRQLCKRFGIPSATKLRESKFFELKWVLSNIESIDFDWLNQRFDFLPSEISDYIVADYIKLQAWSVFECACIIAGYDPIVIAAEASTQQPNNIHTTIETITREFIAHLSLDTISENKFIDPWKAISFGLSSGHPPAQVREIFLEFFNSDSRTKVHIKQIFSTLIESMSGLDDPLALTKEAWGLDLDKREIFGLYAFYLKLQNNDLNRSQIVAHIFGKFPKTPGLAKNYSLAAIGNDVQRFDNCLLHKDVKPMTLRPSAFREIADEAEAALYNDYARILVGEKYV